MPISALPPFVSILMANYNCAPYIAAAIGSALNQTAGPVEVVVVDDCSTDDSVAVVRTLAAADSRIRLIEMECNSGPAVARNRAIAAARGTWVAVLDSDDLMHSDRLDVLLTEARRSGADIVADDLNLFDDAGLAPDRRLLSGAWAEQPFDVALTDYVRSNQLYGKLPSLGYLKPVFRASLFADGIARYNESMRIAEDYDLVLRLLAMGARFRVYPTPLYMYRKRSTSISHRLSTATVVAMLESDRAFRHDFPALPAEVRAALDERRRSLDRALAFERLVGALKTYDYVNAMRISLNEPGCTALLYLPIRDRIVNLKNIVRHIAVNAALFLKK